MRTLRLLTCPESRTRVVNFGIGHGRIAIDAEDRVRRLHLHDDDFAVYVAQGGHRLLLAFDMPVIARMQVIGGKVAGVFVPISADDEVRELHLEILEFVVGSSSVWAAGCWAARKVLMLIASRKMIRDILRMFRSPIVFRLYCRAYRGCIP